MKTLKTMGISAVALILQGFISSPEAFAQTQASCTNPLPAIFQHFPSNLFTDECVVSIDKTVAQAAKSGDNPFVEVFRGEKRIAMFHLRNNVWQLPTRVSVDEATCNVTAFYPEYEHRYRNVFVNGVWAYDILSNQRWDIIGLPQSFVSGNEAQDCSVKSNRSLDAAREKNSDVELTVYRGKKRVAKFTLRNKVWQLPERLTIDEETCDVVAFYPTYKNQFKSASKNGEWKNDDLVSTRWDIKGI